MDQGVELRDQVALHCRRFVLFIILVNGSGGEETVGEMI
jgi:hypothetical protein